MRKGLVAALVAATLVSGCAQRLGDFTMISSKNVDLTRGADFKRAPTRVKGEDMKAVILFIPVGIANMKEALDVAIEKTPGAVALVDAVVMQKSFWFVIGGVGGYEVEGTPLIDPAVEKAYRK
ncbi:hypothetical protein [Methylotetracoccus oryzae]|uniref:hypothetical protein n=1 Tax=Methylotetracoccus oryzae TaxID=1919059 RepID=UPI0019131B29|nr:hypothetical protein [Methylotetracoccus oryzae]